MPKQLNSRCKALVASLIEYFEQERDNNGPLLHLTVVRESKQKEESLDRKVKKSEVQIHKNHSDQKIKKKPNLNSLLQKSADFIHNYNSVFKKPPTHFGDADTYFRQILRNYDSDFLRGSGDSQVIKVADKQDTYRAKEPSVPEKGKKSKSPVFLDDKPFEEDSTVKQLFIGDIETFGETEGSVKSEETEINDTLRQIADETLLTFRERGDTDTRKLKMAEEDFTEDINQEVTEDATAGEVTDTEVTDMPEEDDMEEVERMIKEASNELEQVAEENKQLMEALEESAKEEHEATKAEGDTGQMEFGGSTFKFDPKIDAAVLMELENAEKQAKETAAIIYDLKIQVAELLKKEKMTEVEAKELEEKNKELKKQMQLFEEKTKRIQFLLGQANLFEKMVGPKPALQEKHTEDVLPKVIVCGITEHNMPKIIVCDDKKKKDSKTAALAPCGAPANICGAITSTGTAQQSVVPQFAKKLNQSYTMQERLAAENANLECTRYKLQSDLLNKDQTVESLQRKVTCMQNEMRMICRENCTLNERLNKLQEGDTVCAVPNSTTPPVTKQGRHGKRMPCGKGKGPCPADVESRLQEYSETTHTLEQQLIAMETDVKNMQNELIAVQKEREHLEHHRKMLCKPCPPCSHPCGSLPPCAFPQGEIANMLRFADDIAIKTSNKEDPEEAMDEIEPPCGPPRPPGVEQQLRELKEQYLRLEDDFKSKVTEVAGLRADNEKLKVVAKDAEESKKTIEERLKDLERELKNLRGESKKFVGSKEQLIEQEQQLNVAKQRFREAQDELEELRALIQDQQSQLDDYRNKYLSAQQQVEEQKRQIDMMEMENSRVSEQVNLEIQRVKNQFQEKLQELTPLPDILKNTQIKLQEAQQMHLLAERNNEVLNKDLQMYKDKVQAMLNQMDQVRSDQQLGADEKMGLTSRLEQCEQKCEELASENDQLKTDLTRLEELAEANEMKYQEKLHEVAQLAAQLDNVREESARQVARTKDRCETVRRSMQNQISDLERQLAQSRAQARTAQKDRDEIRQKMQAQINNLNENFEDAQMRIKSLQGHVNYLKHSYTTVFPPSGDLAPTFTEENDPCSCAGN